MAYPLYIFTAYASQVLSDEYSSEKFKVLSCDIDVHKTNTVVNNSVLFYPDISEMAKDIYFALAYYLVLDQKQNASKFAFDDLARK
eukprot:512057-Ditylum_brightwellii.AAC.1